MKDSSENYFRDEPKLSVINLKNENSYHKNIFYQSISGLHYIHSLEVIHR